jgi:DNA-binding MarR family transcriptional regulator
VTADQFVLLTLLAEQDGITQQELVRRAFSDANTVRAMLLRLESRGLVTRGQHPTDRRARSVRLTRRGRRVHEQLWADSAPVRQELLAAFRPEEADTLIGWLSRIGETMMPGRTDGSPRPPRPAATVKT